MIVSSGGGIRWLFHTELADGRWAKWFATAESPASIRVKGVRDPRVADPGMVWGDADRPLILPPGMISFRIGREPALPVLRHALPETWHDLWNAVEDEYAKWAVGNFGWF
ncbi:hypothetical protein [Nocardia stercoris]|uniref:Uncharacterized protein n=1 Tax=Nocardia stercoris TaxID=2483361 RepID=A0A3M2KSH0_9NOCA|nr:hypothetical protein [Nocardia stercoris]RMI28602.1 hypothetical protein EBN03_29790 [Nocardia stercoris]